MSANTRETVTVTVPVSEENVQYAVSYVDHTFSAPRVRTSTVNVMAGYSAFEQIRVILVIPRTGNKDDAAKIEILSLVKVA
jgi:hypothetical protein